ncbi:unnamed protein product [Callosobruchus maculatus]|uniref:Cytochrome P450 n=1 Tax=Callosobruchus maculatus TaxID=64391 RepID=A0A653DN49_CALMS|nr:unnamed protein product [Callosobruchus maculatus]
MLVTATLICTIVTLLLIYLILRNNLHLKDIPKPEANLFWGHLTTLADRSAQLKKVAELTQKYGGLIRLYIPPKRPAVLVADKDILQNILNNENALEKSQDYQYLKVWLGEGLITGGGVQWRNRRRMLTPCFGRMSTLKHFVQIFEKLGDVLVEKFNEQLDNPSFDVFPHMKLFTLDVICETSMGIITNCQRDGNTSYCQSIEEMTRIAIRRMLSPLKRFDAFYQFTNDYQKQKEALKEIDAFYENIISNKKRTMSSKSVEEDEDGSKQNFLDQLLRHQENGEALSDKDIQEEINTFMFGGHDTTATGLSFILYSLARHPNVQEKVLEEQETIFGSLEKDPEVTYAHLQDMKYLDAVINEALRLYPPIPVFGRKLTDDIKLENGVVLPKTLSIGFTVYSVHHNPEYFPDPEKFLPERFLKDDIMPYTHLPFSAGPRSCIGKKFAMLQIKSCISKISRHFKLLPSIPDYELKLMPEITLVSKNGMRISLEKRT